MYVLITGWFDVNRFVAFHRAKISFVMQRAAAKHSISVALFQLIFSSTTLLGTQVSTPGRTSIHPAFFAQFTGSQTDRRRIISHNSPLLISYIQCSLENKKLGYCWHTARCCPGEWLCFIGRILRLLPTLSHTTPSVRRIPSSYPVHIWCGKTRMAGLQSREGCMMIDSIVWAQYINDSRIDRQLRRASIETPNRAQNWLWDFGKGIYTSRFRMNGTKFAMQWVMNYLS